MNEGYIHLWRKFRDGGYIQNHKLCAFMIWSLLKASYKRHEVVVGRQRVTLEPGQFIFGRKKAAEETGLSEQELRTIIEFLKKIKFLTIKSTNKFSVISIVNWPIYQGTGECVQPSNQPATNQQLTTNNNSNKGDKESPAEISSKISLLRDRYLDQETIDQAFVAISSTRKSKRIADSVTLSILKSWERYPIESVMKGIKTFLEKGYQDQGKNEKYLLGIIRNNGNGQHRENESAGSGVMKSTGSALYDDYLGGKIKVNVEGRGQ